MKDTEGLNISVLTMGNNIVDRRRPCNLKPVDLTATYAYIDRLVQDKRVNDETKKMAAAYPQGSLATFCKNVRTYIERAQRKVALTPIQYETELGDEQDGRQSTKLDSIKEGIPDEFN